MKVFLSWSGNRSRRLAEILHRYLPMIIQRAKPWMSEVDIPKGARWASEIGSSLEDHSVGIVCVTPENQAAPWLTFEAGALSKALDSSRVMPVLLGVRPRDVKGPLSQFQATLVEKEEMLKLIRSLNAIQSGASVSNNVVDETFARFWPDLEAELHGVAQMKIEGTSLNISSVTECRNLALAIMSIFRRDLKVTICTVVYLSPRNEECWYGGARTGKSSTKSITLSCACFRSRWNLVLTLECCSWTRRQILRPFDFLTRTTISWIS